MNSPYACADCGGHPTCPQLKDDLWETIKPPVKEVWLYPKSRAVGKSTEMSAELVKAMEDPPLGVYEKAQRPFLGNLLSQSRRLLICVLCMQCAEKRLGRELTVDDLHEMWENDAMRLLIQREISRSNPAPPVSNANAPVADSPPQAVLTVVPVATPGGHLETVDHLEEAYAKATQLLDSMMLDNPEVERAVSRIREHLVHARDQRALGKFLPK